MCLLLVARDLPVSCPHRIRDPPICPLLAECARLLLEHGGVDLAVKGSGGPYKGKTALDIARVNGHTRIVELLKQVVLSRR